MIDQVERLEAEVAALREAVATGREHQAEFARRAGHDLAAPLRGLRSLTSFLREDAADGLDGEALDLLARIDTRVQQMEDVVQSLTAYARSGGEAEAPRSTEVLALCEDAIAAASPPPDFRCNVDVDDDVVHLPLVAVRRSLGWIVENAWHHHDVVGEDPLGTVTIHASITDGFVTFIVSDDGPGMDALTAAHALEPFRSGPARSHTDRGKRAGMGLASASATAAHYGGSVAILAHDPRNTVVRLRWPLSAPLPFS